jgi:hypothetical protein
MRTRYGPGTSIPTTDAPRSRPLPAAIQTSPAWEQNEPYTITLLLKGRSGGASTKHLYRWALPAPAITFYGFRPAPHQTCVTRLAAAESPSMSSVAIVNDTTWSTIVGTWRPGRLELYLDGISRANSTAANTNTSDAFGIYRWGWGFSTNQDFNGDIAPLRMAVLPASDTVQRWQPRCCRQTSGHCAPVSIHAAISSPKVA